MDLKQKFSAVSTCYFISCDDLKEGVQYRIIFADYMATNFGPTVLVEIRENEKNHTKYICLLDIEQYGQKSDIESIIGGKENII
jgi:hypothetical protein